MKLKLKPIEIVADVPFHHDKLNRENNAVVLKELISSLDETAVIAIDAPWGEGKTTFIRMFRQYLINDNFQTLYINAWENDFSDDALATLIGEIELGIQELNIEDESKSEVEKNISKLKKVGSYLVKKSIPIGVKLATAGLIDSEELGKELAKASESIASEQVENYEKAKNNFRNFRSALTKFVDSINEDSEQPLVFFIDELDRCRPTFAIEILEKAKHLFSVPGIIFVIAIDKEQLGHSIRSVYGQGMKVEGYLRRFIDFDYRLPSPNHHEFAKHLFSKYEFEEYFSTREAKDNNYAPEIITSIFGDLSKMFNLSLREQEQCFSLLTIVLQTTPSNFQLFSHLLIFLLVLKMAEPIHYRNYINNVSTVKDVIDFISTLEGDKALLEDHNGKVLEAYLITGRNNNLEISNYYEKYKNSLNDESSDNYIKKRANTIIGVIDELNFSNNTFLVERISRKIDILDRFNKSTSN